MTVWTASGGWRIEVITLDTHRCYKVSKHGYHIYDYNSLSELEQLLERFGIGYADLVADDPAPE